MIQILTRAGVLFLFSTLITSTIALHAASAGDLPVGLCEDDAACNDQNRCTEDRCILLVEVECGDVNRSGSLTAVDALHVLRFATGLDSMCHRSLCDVNANGAVTATDALRVLQTAVGIASGVYCMGECAHEPIDCSDGNACNGEESCDPEQGCVDGILPDCDDGDICTDDTCDDSDGCVHEAVECSDDDKCNGEEFCSRELGCVQAAPLDCDDGNDCTEDRCNSVDGCVHEDAHCDDGDACTLDSCSDEGGCRHIAVNCNDEKVCNGEERCDATLGCLAGEALECDDGRFCNGQEHCDANDGCVNGHSINCSDEDECTEDSCDEEADQCRHDNIGNGSADVISFSGPAAGTIVAEVFGDGGTGPIGVHGMNSHLGDANGAVIYDSACPGECSGKGADLGTPNQTFAGPGIGAGGEAGAPFENTTAQGNVLIVAKDLVDVAPADGLVDVPQDQGHQQPVSTYFDFSAVGPVVLESMKLMDIDGEEAAAVIDIYGDGDVLLATVVAPVTGDNGIATIDLGSIEGAMSMVVSLHGSGAIDDIRLAGDECVAATTTTTTSMAEVTTTTLAQVTTTLGVVTTTSLPFYPDTLIW